ncbi:MAG: PIN domain-containing protein [Candidatus Eremiobacteraeota bacterium]|nr:PIN domain-containing protein [Candidatus Eremiobacteraeota bacterium]
MKRVFVDTGAWYALVDSHDPDHRQAETFLKSNTLPMVTTNFVFDESVTLIKKRLGHHVAVEFGERLMKSPSVMVLPVEPRDQEEAWRIFSEYRDLDFTYTDCTSFAVMKRLSLVTAFAFDSHFTMMGFSLPS